MTEPEDPKDKPAEATDAGSKEATDEPKDPSPAVELRAAFDHLKSAAGLLFGRLQNDEGLKKALNDAEGAAERAATGVERAAATAAVEAEKAVRTLGERAQPIAKDIGAELERLAKTVRTALEPEPIPSEPTAADTTSAPQADEENRENAETKAEAERNQDEAKKES